MNNDATGYENAYNTVMSDIFIPVFFAELAARGHAPRTEEEADVMLKSAAQLMRREQAHVGREVDKQAEFVRQQARELGVDVDGDAATVESYAEYVLSQPKVAEAVDHLAHHIYAQGGAA